MAKRTKKTHPERAVLKGSGGEYVVTKVQMLFETTKLLAKKFRKSYVRGNYNKKEGYQQHMILSTKGRKFRKKYASDKEPINTRTYNFFSKKYQSLIFGIK